MSVPRPITLLIAALGGEGGGVLTDWIISAVADAGYPVQSTSIPGVAQRTGATTYYIEILPVKSADLAGKRPVFALTPGVGDIDMMVASELLEAARAVAAGFVTPSRTQMIASLSRFYTMDEKIAMGDGRFDQKSLVERITAHSMRAMFMDMTELARQSGSIISAVMLGAIIGSDRLPLTVAQCEAAIRKDGKAVDSNLRGFRAGYEAARGNLQPVLPNNEKSQVAVTLQSLEKTVVEGFPASAQAMILEGVRRLVLYQSVSYARLYLRRLAPLVSMGGNDESAVRLLNETARHLAVRMSFEDIVRVAQAKIAPARIARIAKDELHVKDEPYSVNDFLKPGIEELTQLLPSAIAKPVLRYAKQKGWLGRVYFGMTINTTSISGYLRFLLLAKLRCVRPYGHRFAEEQTQIETWLGLVADAARRSPVLALEIVECARLIKGYGDTYTRGLTNYFLIEQRLIRPAVAGGMALQRAIDAIGSARAAALLDPEGESLGRCLAQIGAVDQPA